MTMFFRLALPSLLALGCLFPVFSQAAPARALKFPKVAVKVFGAAPFQLQARAADGRNVDYVSGNERVATVQGSVATVVGVGTTTITASIADYLAETGELITAQRVLKVLPRRQRISLSTKSVRTLGENFEIFVSSNSPDSARPIEVTSGNPEILSVELIEGRYWATAKAPGRVRLTARQQGDANHVAAKPVTRIVNVRNPAGLAAVQTVELFGGQVLMDIPSAFRMTEDADGYKFGTGDGKGGAMVLSVSKYGDLTTIGDFANTTELYYNTAGTQVIVSEIAGNIYTVETKAKLLMARGAARQRFIFFNDDSGRVWDKEQVIWGMVVDLSLPPSTGIWGTPKGKALRQALETIRLNPEANTSPRY